MGLSLVCPRSSSLLLFVAFQILSTHFIFPTSDEPIL